MRNRLFIFLLFWSFATSSQSFVPGNTYFDDNEYVEYLAGNLPIVLSVPHGGYLEPDDIPDRNCGGCSYVRDSYTQELARELQAAFEQETGCYPHIVINLLHRKKFDANRDIDDAADGNSSVEQSWFAYHEFLDSAKAIVVRDYNRGLFLDLHGHGHEIQRIELGYTLSKSELQESNATLNTNNYILDSSIRTLVGDNLSGLSHADLLRGSISFGALLDDRGFPSVPSQDTPYPEDEDPYFSGGYNTQRHGSEDGGAIDGIQIECNQDIRFNEDIRLEFADGLSQVIIDYIDLHYNAQFEGNFCQILVHLEELPKRSSFLSIHPNPAITEFSLMGELQKGAEVIIYTPLGQKLQKILLGRCSDQYSASKKRPVFSWNFVRMDTVSQRTSWSNRRYPLNTVLSILATRVQSVP